MSGSVTDRLNQLRSLAAPSASLRAAFNNDPKRAARYSTKACGITLDYAKNLIDDTSWQALQQLAVDSDISKLRQQMLDGTAINNTEQRPVWHTRLRQQDVSGLMLNGEDIGQQINDCRARMAALIDTLHQQQYLGYQGRAITDLIWVGIGGSLLGPQMAVEALTPYHCSPVKLHFAGNIDGAVVSDILAGLDPATTLVVVASKSFGTEETKQNALAIRQWFTDHGADKKAIGHHFWATSSNIAAAAEFGIEQKNILPMWDWVGGRYSLWSAIGLPVALMIGNQQFSQLLAGAAAMDQHFFNAPFAQNMPVIMALLGVWYINGHNCQAQALLPYSHYLRLLPSYVQQLDMESNGKGVGRDGNALPYATAPVIWGDAGTNGQHAYHQLLHQSALTVPADFILPLKARHPLQDQHSRLAAHCFAQTQALMQGKTLQEATAECLAQGMNEQQAKALAPHKVSPGNKPSNTLLLPELSPYYLGALIALYEHKVFCQGAIWQLNSFDQWGVELGKQLSGPIYQTLTGNSHHSFDGSTTALIKTFLAAKH
ncbi:MULTISPECIES: glucose-6-phosphate isomerase [unclassified Arsukibacterium]|uniref:glucose-6-phosphate isomerase n=1 Tax=unclassified Arsukibacterium TaxID=2635278 RepID=UPI000C639384|nr:MULTISPECIES: glucose-6-phosphate isomerase [unclassified Arsukibacterium]MAA93814.1 glucose-6-phosphate isomerase [Rheinheimera sp.]MBM34368.1 glucose-6-phosphate isomerase [Rheinheimera sp.]HAW92104.1 glucose-6-phosphate isomerase [Candidatus Azambacteria bacterium]